jgi:hypothetical protein
MYDADATRRLQVVLHADESYHRFLKQHEKEKWANCVARKGERDTHRREKLARGVIRAFLQTRTQCALRAIEKSARQE